MPREESLQQPVFASTVRKLSSSTIKALKRGKRSEYRSVGPINQVCYYNQLIIDLEWGPLAVCRKVGG